MFGNRYKNFGRRLQYRAAHGLTVRQYQKRFEYFNMLMGGNPIKRKFNTSNYSRKRISSKGKFKSLKVERKFATSKGRLTYKSKKGQTVSEYVKSDLKTDSEFDVRKQNYPALGFRFKVTSTLSDVSGDGLFDVSDSFFQSISGIKATAGESVIVNSGFNNSQYKLPTGTTYPDLILTRGLIRKSSSFGQWCYDFLIKQGQEFDKIKTRTITVMLLGENLNDILMQWSFYNCYPKELEIGAFNADKSEIAIETLTMVYSYLSKN
jgi:phage tail-like protein